MSRGIIEIPIEVWEGCERDAGRIAFLHKQVSDLAAENERLRQHLEFFRGKFDAKSNKLLARILKDTKKFVTKKGRDAK